jgi:molybdopterin-guanine dinucleotide biosynthesis adapter protein
MLGEGRSQVGDAVAGGFGRLRVFGVVGWKDNGKTTLVERLVAHLTSQGMKVSTVKHAHHTVEFDMAGKDSWRHREAGAVETIVATSRRFAIFHELRDEPEPPLDRLLDRLSAVDLVLVEGFKAFPHPKIEVHRQARATPLLAMDDPSILAIASDEPLPDADRPVFGLDDVGPIAGFVLAHARLHARP